MELKRFATKTDGAEEASAPFVDDDDLLGTVLGTVWVGVGAVVDDDDVLGTVLGTVWVGVGAVVVVVSF